MPKSEKELRARDAERDIGQELLRSVREMKAGRRGKMRGTSEVDLQFSAQLSGLGLHHHDFSAKHNSIFLKLATDGVRSLAMKTITAVLLCFFLVACATPKTGELMVDPRSASPVESLAVVLFMAKPANKNKEDPIFSRLEQEGYFDGRFAAAIQDRMRVNFSTNGVLADVHAVNSPKELKMLGEQSKASHLLIMEPKTFFMSLRVPIPHLGGVDIKLIERNTKRVIWKSEEAIAVTLAGHGADRIVVGMLNSWAEAGIVKFKSETAMTAEGKSRW